MESILFGLKKNRPLLNKILKVFISSSKKGIFKIYVRDNPYG